MAPISRRAFLKRTAVLSTGVVLYIYSDGRYRMVVQAAGPEVYRLRIVHTNDHHARVEPVSVTIQPGTPAVTRNFGGLARRKTVFDAIRAEAAAAPNALDKNILFLDAGDIFQGTLWFNTYAGLADLEFYRALGYDATTIGNHEFDKGDAPLADFITGATTGTFPTTPTVPGAIIPGGTRLTGTNFSVISANINVASGPLQGKIQPNLVKTVGGQKIGIFGLTTPDTKETSSPSANVSFADIVTTATAQVAALQAQGCNKIIALTHLGYGVDQQLAAVAGIDVIIGGHSHSALLPTGDARPLGKVADGAYPTTVTRGDGTVCVIVTDWEWGKWVGDITIGFDTNGDVTGARSAGTGPTTAGSFAGTIRPVWADGIANGRTLLPNEEADVGANSTFDTRITALLGPIDTIKQQQVGSSTVDLDGARNNVRTRETNLGNLVADAFLAKARPFGAVAALTNGGGIRASIAAGEITLGEVIDVAPFSNTLVVVTLTGTQLRAALENGVSQVETVGGRFPQVAGLRYRWASNAPVGSRIQSVEIQVDRSPGFEPIDPAASYRIATTNFLLNGGDGYTVLGQGTDKVDTFFIDSDVIAEYITANSPVATTLQGRITAVRLTFFTTLLRLGSTTTVSVR